LLILSKRLATAFFVGLALKPGRVILRFVFYKITVKFYRLYLYAAKKSGWAAAKNRSKFALAGQKSIHLSIIALTVILVFANFASKTKAETLMDKASQTILADLVKSEFVDIEEERLVEESFNENFAALPARQSYLDDLPSVKAAPMARITHNENDGIKNGALSLEGTIIKPNIVSTKKTKRPRSETIVYTVKPGDSISTIAQNFGVRVRTILWENGLNAYSIIRPGDKLSILPVDGITHKVRRGDTLSKIAKQYNIDKQEIIKQNKLTDASRLSVGQKLIIPNGKKTRYARAKQKKYSGINVIKSLVKLSGAKPVSGNKMNWPTVRRRITQYYSWRHPALDIADKTGTPIYAADAGVVERAGWGRGYGLHVVINHGGGRKTRYAHASKLYVKKGDKVSKGEVIAAIGSTGWSTGPHVHFEVIINGKKYNPFNYTK